MRRYHDELVCDLAETYQIYDFRSMPAHFIAILAAGLGPDSRVVRKLTGQNYSTDTMILAMICDAANLLVWQHTKDAEHGRNRPQSVHEALLGQQKKEGLRGFGSAEEFDQYRERMLKG